MRRSIVSVPRFRNGIKSRWTERSTPQKASYGEIKTADGAMSFERLHGVR